MRMLITLCSFLSLNLSKQCGGALFTGSKCCVEGYTCVKQNDYYSQCLLSNSPEAISASLSASAAQTRLSTSTLPSPVTIATPYKTTTTISIPGAATHTQGAYPAGGGGCSGVALVDNVCCPAYCSNDMRSEGCGNGCSGKCTTPPSEMCKSGTMWPEVHSVGSGEKWHYSRSTHYGITSAGACGYGLYGMCTRGGSKEPWVDDMLRGACDAFCTAYPALCQDPEGVRLRGNFAAPNGDYYTQFWGSLPGDRDNYLSCGECFELIHTKPDGTDYVPGEAGYTDSIVLEITDSCPCWPNPKWCCGSGGDHCGEIDFKYGCPLPKDSIHLDLSDIAMGRLQGNGSQSSGVIPTRYRRVSCPKPGNAYVWVHDGAGPYYMQLSAMNAAGTGSITNIEVRGDGMANWMTLIQQPDFLSSRPQERYGAWQFPKDVGPFKVPIGVRLTSATGEVLVNENLIKSFTPPASAPSGWWYLDMGVQFNR
ncbi:putative swollenin [Clohesyomyces aquaticus]|uniref:Putative swollenin n=1 Tax=Clohesyomyces aquaticus TaxID=1231657 RepID=A0A1Y1YVS7_9PLEO|nr:putative swollenin [Clohesyomyces aquaticus]